MLYYTAAAKVKSYNEVKNKEDVDYIILSGVPSFEKAVKRIEEYYQENLISVNLILLDEPFATLDEESFEKYLQQHEVS